MAQISSCQHVLYAFTSPRVLVSNYSIPTLSDAASIRALWTWRGMRSLLCSSWSLAAHT